MGSTTSTSLLDEIAAEARANGPGGRCPVPGVLAALGDEGEVVLQQLEHGVPATAIARVLNRRGLHIRGDALRNHRRRLCRCEA
ncbi:MAG: hypothetical protein NVSMB4_08160 [Acidimicrobiales bacterium]